MGVVLMIYFLVLLFSWIFICILLYLILYIYKKQFKFKSKLLQEKFKTKNQTYNVQSYVQYFVETQKYSLIFTKLLFETEKENLFWHVSATPKEPPELKFGIINNRSKTNHTSKILNALLTVF